MKPEYQDRQYRFLDGERLAIIRAATFLGREFESFPARHFGTELGTSKPAVFALEAATSVRRSALFDPMMRSCF
jgi:hypothetical protein